MKLCGDSQCKRSGQLLPLTEFPKNNHNKSGRHSYCRKCSVRRANENRLKNKPRLDVIKQQRELERERQRQARLEQAKREELLITDRVYREIARGNATREGIEATTGLHEDVISDALASLYDANLIRPNGPRFYRRANAA